jgi:hypothetical protein
LSIDDQRNFISGARDHNSQKRIKKGISDVMKLRSGDIIPNTTATLVLNELLTGVGCEEEEEEKEEGEEDEEVDEKDGEVEDGDSDGADEVDGEVDDGARGDEVEVEEEEEGGFEAGVDGGNGYEIPFHHQL